MSILFLFLFFALGHGQTTKTYSQDGYTLNVVDKSNGQLSAAIIQNQVRIFYQLYPSMSVNYVGAPKTLTLTFDSALSQNAVELLNTSLSLSVVSLKANGNDSNYMQVGLSYLLNSFYSTKTPGSSTSTIKMVTTTTPLKTTKISTSSTTTTKTGGTNIYSQNGYTLILVDKSNGQIPATTIQNQVETFFYLYPLMTSYYMNAPKTLPLIFDTAIFPNKIELSNTSLSLSVASLKANGNYSNYMQIGLTYLLYNFYSINTSGLNTSITKSPGTISSISPTYGTNIYNQNNYTLILVDKSNGQLSSTTVQNQVNLFFQLYPSMTTNYDRIPTTFIIILDGTKTGNLVTNLGFTLSVVDLLANGNSTNYMQTALNQTLSRFYSIKFPGTISTTNGYYLYTQNNYSLNLVINSNGQLSATTIKNQIELFFKIYPLISGNYVGAPTKLTISLDVFNNQNSILLLNDALSLSVANLKADGNNTAHMQVGLSYLLGYYYPAKYFGTSITTPKFLTTTTSKMVTTTAPKTNRTNIYNRNGYTLILVDNTNGQLPTTTIQNQVDMFFFLYPLMAGSYIGTPTNLTIALDPFYSMLSIKLSKSVLPLSVANLRANGNDTEHMRFGLSYLLSYYYSTKFSVLSTSTSNFLTTTTPKMSSTTKIAGTNIYSQNGYTLILVDNSNGQLPTSTIQNQVNLFFQLYPSMSTNYVGPPTVLTIAFDPFIALNSISLSSAVLSLSVANLKTNGNDTNYLQFGLKYLLDSFYSTKNFGSSTSTTATKITSTTPKIITMSTQKMVSTSTPKIITMSTQKMVPTSSGSPINFFQQMMLDTHNNYRKLLTNGTNVQSARGLMPNAADMNQLNYSISLEASANAWASQCTIGHTPNATYGQNICASSAQETYQTSFFLACAQLWWNEVVKFPSNTNLTLPSQNFDQFGHFTQMAWHTTKAIGCAVQLCPKIGTILVCNYDQGNVIGSPIYVAGNTCSGCKSSCSNGLCL